MIIQLSFQTNKREANSRLVGMAINELLCYGIIIINIIIIIILPHWRSGLRAY